MADITLPAPVELASRSWYDCLGQSVGKLWEDRICCDLMFVCRGGKELHAHSCVLQAASPLMRNWVISSWHNKGLVYRMDHVNSDCLYLLLHFIYYGKVNVPADQSHEFQSLVDLFKIDVLSTLCTENLRVQHQQSTQLTDYVWPHKKARKYQKLPLDSDTRHKTDTTITHDPLNHIISNTNSNLLHSEDHSSSLFTSSSHSVFSRQSREGTSDRSKQSLSAGSSSYSHGHNSHSSPDPHSHASLLLYMQGAAPLDHTGDISLASHTVPSGGHVQAPSDPPVISRSVLPAHSTLVSQSPNTSSLSRPPPPTVGSSLDTSAGPCDMRDLWTSMDMSFTQQHMSSEDLNMLTAMPSPGSLEGSGSSDLVTSAATLTSSGYIRSSKKHKVRLSSKHSLKEKLAARKKRSAKPELWKCNIRKVRKNRGLSYVSVKGKVIPGKNRSGPCCNCRVKCYEKISEEECNAIFVSFFSLGDKNTQDAVLFSSIERDNVKRHRTKNEVVRVRSNTFVYKVRKRDGKTVSVCQKAFMSIYGVSNRTIRRIQTHIASGNIAPPVDMRGKTRKNLAASEDTCENTAPSTSKSNAPSKSKPDQLPLPEETPT